jgi:hypothetical protein
MTVAPLPTGVASTSVWATPGLSAFRIEYGAIPAKDVHQYGYPSSVGSGKFAIHTNSETTFTAKFVSFPTLQGPGSSGGPHLIGKRVVAVTSVIDGSAGELVFAKGSPLAGTAVRTAYESAIALSEPTP